MAQYDINLREYWRILKKRKSFVILITVVLGLFSTAFAILGAPDPIYSTVCLVEIKKSPVVQGVYSKTISFSESDDIETQVSIVKSYRVIQKVAERLDLIPRGTSEEGTPLKESVVPIIERLQDRVEVTRDGYTSILRIKVTDSDPAFAQRLANALGVTYKEIYAEQQMKQITAALKYITEQLDDVRERLRRAEDEFNRFTKDNELLSIDLQSEALLAKTQATQNEMQKLQEEKTELEEILLGLTEFQENPSGAGYDFYSAKASTHYQSTNEILVELLLKRDTLLKDFTPKHPEVISIDHQIIENARKMILLLRQQMGGLEKKTTEFKRDLETVERKTQLLMDKKLEFDRLKRRVELYNDMTALLERKNQEALISRAERPEEVNIIKPALLPGSPINPPRTLATAALGLVIGLILGLVVAFVVESFDTSLGAIEDVEETLGTKVLGIIPHGDPQNLREHLKGEYPEGLDGPSVRHVINLISHFAPKSMMAEGFRALRTNIQFIDTEKNLRTIAITSTSPEEGKTLAATNLAITMAQAGMKTLLIGSDLRKPVLDKVFGVDRGPGLTDILLGSYPWRQTVKTITDMIMGKMGLEEIMATPGLDNLHLITSGPIPPNPTELINSDRLVGFFEEAREEYDMILLDSCPILSAADAAILGTKVDGVLLVYRVGKVSRGLLKRSAAQLSQVKCNILGVILNGMRPDVSPDFQDYKYYTYYSYGLDGHEKGDQQEDEKGVLSAKQKEDLSVTAEEIFLKKGTLLREDGQKRTAAWRLFLMVVATAFLTTGILWQNGLLNPLKVSSLERLLDRGGVGEAKSQRGAHPAFQREPEAIPPAEGGAVVTERPGAYEVFPIQVDSPEISVKPANPMASPVSVAPPGTREAGSFREALSSATKGTGADRPEGGKKDGRYPYSLSLAAFRTREQVETAVARYEEKGLHPYWAKVDLGKKGVWFRVFAGHFEDMEQAQQFQKTHGLLGAVVKKTPYTTLIGACGSKDGLHHMAAPLIDLGYSAYAIEGDEGGYCLFVGAFVTEEGARAQQQALRAKGIQSTVVQR